MLEINRKRHELTVRLTGLRYPGVAIKMIRDENEVPAGADRPFKNRGKHMAICQAFAFVRRQGKIIYMEPEDHWCWNPLITYGMLDRELAKEGFRELHRRAGTSAASADAFVDSYPSLPYGEYKGVLMAPLDKADFQPDVTIIYCKNDQLRLLLMAVSSQTHQMVDSSFSALNSCVYSVIPAIQQGCYRITLPDPGEYERGMTPEDDIIFSVPKQREEEFYKGVEYQIGHGDRYSYYMNMEEDFPRPPIYNVLFEKWGLMTGRDWDK